MPLMKSKSKEAFGHNVKAELAAGKPLKQSLAIAYSEKREAAKSVAKRASNKRPSNTSTQHHSEHSAKRSNDYHDRVIDATRVRPTATKLSLIHI